MTEAQGKLKLLTLEAEANNISKLDMISKFTNLGLPQEFITRIQDLFEFTKKLGTQTIHIGKIIIKKIIDFVNENPNLVIGLAIGVSLSVLIGMLISTIPIIGTTLAPIITSIITPITTGLGVLRGHKLDKVMNGEYVGDSIIQDMITIAKKFWAFFVDILTSVKNYLKEDV